MSYKINKSNAVWDFTFEEPKLDYQSISFMENQIIKDFEKCSKIVFNMEKVEFISSAFIRLCLEAIQRVGQENFEIINACKLIRTILKISKFDNFVKVSE